MTVQVQRQAGAAPATPPRRLFNLGLTRSSSVKSVQELEAQRKQKLESDQDCYSRADFLSDRAALGVTQRSIEALSSSASFKAEVRSPAHPPSQRHR